MTTIGIDLSLTSPALCVSSRENFSVNTCTFHYLTSLKKTIVTDTKLKGQLYPLYGSDMARYELISTWILKFVDAYSADSIYLEDYAFGATGRVFNIAENTGILKYRLWTRGLTVQTVAPTVIKKFATGKGNANKEAMQDSFITETGLNIKETLQLTDKQWNPSSDIIDSYYICKYGVSQIGQEKK